MRVPLTVQDDSPIVTRMASATPFPDKYMTIIIMMNMTIEVSPRTPDVFTVPHPRASFAAGANAVSILCQKKVIIVRHHADEYNWTLLQWHQVHIQSFLYLQLKVAIHSEYCNHGKHDLKAA